LERSRIVVQRGLGLVYLIAFVVAWRQFRPLLGERGLTPVPRFLSRVSMRQAPSLFQLRYSDRLAMVVAAVGTVASVAVVSGVVERAPLWASMAVWALLWVLYLSIVNVGQRFYGFGWETLLLEAGFLAIFLGSSEVAPPVVTLWLFRWLLFRVEFGAGLIKLRGDRCWRDLTCLYYHHETQPLPNPLSWYAHHLPKVLHRVEVAANHVAQLVAPVLLLAPQPVAGGAAAFMIVTQCWLLLTGNFSWLNLLTIVIAAAALPDPFLEPLLPGSVVPGATAGEAPLWWMAVVVAVAALVVVLSYRPARNLLSRRQRMNSSFDPLRLVNTYGAFGHITKVRYELVVEGTDEERLGDRTVWREYGFKAKPGDPQRRPPQVAPYHLRLDWLMWFAAMSPPGAHPWVRTLAARLLENDRPTLRLLRHNPFPDHPPTFVRIRRYRYRFTSREDRRRTGRWWDRTLLDTYLPPVRVRPAADRPLDATPDGSRPARRSGAGATGTGVRPRAGG
jgi:hypothetical protein